MAPAPANDANNLEGVCGSPTLPCINREGRLIPTNEPPYNAKTAVGSLRNNDPTKPTTELARTGSATAESSLHSRKKMVANDPSM
mmetsp:Transcript_6244/g.14140  ORF Transcript_6244/g.14140 Transcript_6244/m.14140 type:complete len:85 (-) Transcript_6244:1016-1270(-)